MMEYIAYFIAIFSLATIYYDTYLAFICAELTYQSHYYAAAIRLPSMREEGERVQSRLRAAKILYSPPKVTHSREKGERVRKDTIYAAKRALLPAFTYAIPLSPRRKAFLLVWHLV